jgi:Ras-related protein Rab-1A
MSSEYNYASKVLVIGDSGCGKSALIIRYCDNEFSESYFNTIGVDFKMKTKEINNIKIKINIWDTAGQEKFRSLVSSYYRNADIVILTFDLTNIQSFRNIEYWYNEIDFVNQHNKFIYLVGTKCDNINNIVVDKDEIDAFSKKYDIKYYDTSAKKNINISDLFDNVFEEIYNIYISKLNKPNLSEEQQLIIEETKNKYNCINCTIC